jgi:hypothetical protein
LGVALIGLTSNKSFFNIPLKTWIEPYRLSAINTFEKRIATDHHGALSVMDTVEFTALSKSFDVLQVSLKKLSRRVKTQ